MNMADPLAQLLAKAFHAACEAERLIYAACMPRDMKDHANRAHSHLLALKNAYPVKP